MRRVQNRETDNPQAPPGKETDTTAHPRTEKPNQTDQTGRTPSGAYPEKSTIGTNTEERTENHEETKINDYISKHVVNKYIHATLNVLKAADTKEEMTKKICIILKNLLATMENTRAEPESSKKGEKETQEKPKPNHG